MESVPEDWVNAVHAGRFWMFLRSLRSNLNPSLSMWIFYTQFPVLLIVFIRLLFAGLSGKTGNQKEKFEVKG